jgi:hypothetical protein
MQVSLKKIYPILIVFFFISALIYTSKKFLFNHNIDERLLHFGNVFFLTLTIISMYVQLKGIHHKNPNVFVRSVMSSMMIKMFLTVIAVFIYVTSAGNNFNKRGILIALFFYLIYLAAEVMTVLKLNKNKNA